VGAAEATLPGVSKNLSRSGDAPKAASERERSQGKRRKVKSLHLEKTPEGNGPMPVDMGGSHTTERKSRDKRGR